MKKILLAIVALTTLAITTQAALVAHWGFDSFTGSPLPRTIAPEDGSQVSTAVLTIDSTSLIPNTRLASVPGTEINDPRLSPLASQAVEFQGQAGNQSGLTIHVSGTGLNSFKVTYAAQRSAAATSQNLWQWSINNVFFFNVGVVQPTAIDTTFGTFTADFSAVSALNGAANVYLRSIGSGGDNNTDYDNFQVLATVPEPINVALALFGLAFAGLKFGRRVSGLVRK